MRLPSALDDGLRRHPLTGRSAISHYNPRRTSLRHGVEEPGDIQDIRLVVDTIPTLAWSARPDGSAEFHNQRWLDYAGLSARRALGSGWEVAVHPDDLPRILETFREAGQSSFATYALANERNVVKVSSEVPLERLGPLGCGIQTGAGAVMNGLMLGRVQVSLPSARAQSDAQRSWQHGLLEQ
jgi:PAS domain-containing protein